MITFFGGAFNPPHMGHYLTAAYFLACEPKGKLLIVPSARHPYNKDMVPFRTRVKWCGMMAKLLGPRAEVSDIEDALDGPSKTYLVVQLLKKKYRQPLQMLVGADTLLDLPKWYEAEKLQKEITFFAVGRQPLRTETGHLAMPDVSSTELRQRLAKGQSCEGLVPAPVLTHMLKNGFYAAPASAR